MMGGLTEDSIFPIAFTLGAGNAEIEYLWKVLFHFVDSSEKITYSDIHYFNNSIEVMLPLG